MSDIESKQNLNELNNSVPIKERKVLGSTNLSCSMQPIYTLINVKRFIRLEKASFFFAKEILQGYHHFDTVLRFVDT